MTESSKLQTGKHWFHEPCFLSVCFFPSLLSQSAKKLFKHGYKNLADFGGKRILLVEDIELNREIAEVILTESGFLVETAPDGTDAVSMMECLHPAKSRHLPVNDIGVIRISLFPCTFCTINCLSARGCPLRTIEEEARDAGVTAFCAKPLFMSDLKSVLLAANNLVDKKEEVAEWTLADFGGKR